MSDSSTALCLEYEVENFFYSIYSATPGMDHLKTTIDSILSRWVLSKTPNTKKSHKGKLEP